MKKELKEKKTFWYLQQTVNIIKEPTGHLRFMNPVDDFKLHYGIVLKLFVLKRKHYFFFNSLSNF